jgi:hypothetical protein
MGFSEMRLLFFYFYFLKGDDVDNISVLNSSPQRFRIKAVFLAGSVRIIS